MLKKLYLSNFKCFQELELELENLTLLSGMNSMGKSTVIQALLLLRNSYENGFLNRGIFLNNDYTKIGLGKNLLNSMAGRDDPFQIGIEDKQKFIWSIQYESDADFLKVQQSEKGAVGKMNLFGRGFEFLSAERLGPRSSYQKSYFHVHEKEDMGVHGEYAVHFLYENENMQLQNTAVLHPFEKINMLRIQAEKWLSEISPGLKISFDDYERANLMGIQIRQTGGDIIYSYSPQNVGFGISYILPVIVALLKAKEGDLVILENPEAHLHPKGQRKMGELITKAASGGVQVILETHSDHILNGIRLSVLNKEITPDKIRLYYFGRDENMKPVVENPVVNDDGRLNFWPDGFFDEWDKAIDEMF
ncbi:AAA family ATPase [[Clostridium] polysaccharolyticum]|uniref:Predicted ATPase n=1 Tax=[Clostridium] polysaccharolyticum TaxID=29364 RepID=A0A1I0FMU6_9FIRM|nr:DUF3696 domain-containing protein [[Clostridium] polysaccharolyticum]SET59648.1 Predicted ATPase [[Clostridium] polysaccharolyticum]